MADQGASAEELERWRNSYYDQLQQLDDKEREWAQTEKVLRRCASRLAAAMDPQEPELAQELRGLRTALNNHETADALETRIQRLADGLLQSGGPDGPAAAAAPRRKGLRGLFGRGEPEEPPEAAGLRRLLDELQSDLGLDQEARLLRRRVDAAADADALEAVAADLAGLLRERFGAAEADPTGPGGSGEGIAIHDLLIRLLERLQIPADLADEVAAMKRSLEDGLAPDAVEPTLTAIADLMARVRSAAQQEKQEIEGFLKELTGHLQALDAAFQDRESDRRESLAHGRDLDEAVSAQVRGLETSVAQSDDLAVLKRTIQERVSTIREHMESFRQGEEARAQKAEAEAERLAERLKEVEQEADGLRERIIAERRQAFFDPLTGIHNRLAYDQRIEQEFARWRRYGAPLTMMIWDVDRFKEVNDTYGHQAGDKVLRVIAKLLSQRVRDADFVARYGGEEFVVLLPETELDHARAVAEKLREGIAEADFHYRGDHVAITISCGIAAFREGDDSDSVFRRADAALYRAKEEGRNRCCAEEAAEG